MIKLNVTRSLSFWPQFHLIFLNYCSSAVQKTRKLPICLNALTQCLARMRALVSESKALSEWHNVNDNENCKNMTKATNSHLVAGVKVFR